MSIDVGYCRPNNFPTRPEFRQFNRRNNEIYASCYSLYKAGKSLQYIAETHYNRRFTRQSLYDSFCVRGYKLRSKKLRPAKIYKGVIFRADSDGLYRSRVNGKLVYLHRLIFEENYGPVPCGHYVIFKDANKANIVIGNLKCLVSCEAKKLYNYGNQFGYKRYTGKGAFGK